MKEIRSKDNRIYKECLRLSQRKYRDKEGRYLIEGFNLIGEAPCRELDYIVIRESQALEAPDFGRVYLMEDDLFGKIAQTQTSQGILAVMNKHAFSIEEIAEAVADGGNVLVLDRLQDPGNIGTMIRTAEGAGYKAVFALKGTADVYSPKTIRAAAGSVFRIPIIHVEDNRELAALTGKLNKRLTVTSLQTDKFYYDVDLSEDIALVIGNEGNGVSEELLDMADIKVKIPMEGSLESLNASVAAGILMYETQRK